MTGDNPKANTGDAELGATLRRLRGRLSLRDVTKAAGVSASHLSQIERGGRLPGAKMLGRLADAYGVDVRPLLRQAGYLNESPFEAAAPAATEEAEVERAYRFVLADPAFRVGTRPDGPLSLSARRFIVEMYERFTGRRLLP